MGDVRYDARVSRSSIGRLYVAWPCCAQRCHYCSEGHVASRNVHVVGLLTLGVDTAIINQ
jgi:coproporphyrinogen III oxidase-like Fe-S oxidoreductase